MVNLFFLHGEQHLSPVLCSKCSHLSCDPCVPAERTVLGNNPPLQDAGDLVGGFVSCFQLQKHKIKSDLHQFTKVPWGAVGAAHFLPQMEWPQSDFQAGVGAGYPTGQQLSCWHHSCSLYFILFFPGFYQKRIKKEKLQSWRTLRNRHDSTFRKLLKAI